MAPAEDVALSVLADNLELRVTADHLEVIEPGERTIVRHAASGLHACQAAFLEAVKTGNMNLIRCPYGDAIRTLEVALAANIAAQTGRVVNL
jgi:hypothetical protein